MRMPTVGLGPLAIRRVYRTAPEHVWRAWTDASALRVWFGQGGTSAWRADWQVRAGNRFRLVMGDSEGRAWLAYGAFREVVPQQRLVLTWSWRLADADAVDGAEAIITVQLAATAGGTELDFRLDPMTDPHERDAWRADFKRLREFLHTERIN